MVDVSRWTVQKDWENPAIYERNRCRMHVPLRSYDSKDAALRYFTDGPQVALQRRVIDLNSDTGEWKFKLFAKPEHVTADFWKPDYNDKGWGDIIVPGNWEMQGHSFPIYTNFKYPWPITSPYVPEENPTGCYRRAFTLPDSTQSSRLEAAR